MEISELKNVITKKKKSTGYILEWDRDERR